MNNYKKYFLSLLLVSSFGIKTLEIPGFTKSQASLDVKIGQEKQSDLTALKVELENLEKKEALFWQENNPKIETVKSQITSLEETVKDTEKPEPFVTKKLLLLKSIRQVTSTIKSTWKEIFAGVKQHIAVLEAYVKDPEFSSLQLEKKAFNTFADLQELQEQIAGQEEKQNALKTEKNEMQLNLANSKKKEAAADADYKEQLQKQTDFIQNKIVPAGVTDGIDVRNYPEMLDAQVMLALYEKEQTQLRVKEQEIKLATLTSQFEIEDKKIQALKKKRDLMSRMSLRVDEKDVQYAKSELAEKKKKYLNETEFFTQKIDKLIEKEEREKEIIRQLTEKYKGSVTNVSELTEWTTQISSAQKYLALAHVGEHNEQLLAIERELDLLRGQVDLEKIEYQQQEISVKIVETWHKIKHQKFRTNEDFTKELKLYETLQAELEREKNSFEDRRKTATGRLNIENKSLSTVKELFAKVNDPKQVIFKGTDGRQQHCLNALSKAESALNRQVKFTGEIISVYSKGLVSLNRSKRHVASMIAELQRVTLWHRSGRAISWQGLGNLLPDMKAFVSDVKTLGFSYLAGFTLQSIMNKFTGLINDPVSLFFLLLQLLLITVLFYILRAYLARISEFLERISQEIRGAYLTSLFVSLVLQFLNQNLTGLFIWSGLFLLFGYQPSPEITGILFYLISIVYLLYLGARFSSYFARYNQEHDYIFFSESFQRRFIPFLDWFFAATVIIFLFREAFILATYTKSELPDILLALYSIIIRVLLLTLIRKEDILAIIPTKTAVWSTVWRFVDNYYYPVLFAFIIVMILMDPHIGGYNNLVYYLVWGIIGSLLIAKLCYELYVLTRRSSSFLFFSSDGEVLRERFTFSKSLYGTSIILLFIFFSLLCAFCIAWVWGYPVSLKSIAQFFTADRLTITGTGGELQKVSIIDFIKILSYIPLGLLIGYIVDRYIVNRIFSVLLVNPGVHNAISTITYYIVVISVITIGFWAEGFGFVVAFYIAPILLGIAWSLRDIFNDFVAYFVILIQRPLKVGDYIKIDEETSGVVRHITPRAVVLRRKQGYCIVVPNSRIVKDTISNWDYNLSFISCPDIHVQVPYRFDPQKIKELLKQAADECTRVLKTPAPIIRLEEFADNGFEFLIRVFISSENTLLQWEAASDVRLAITRLLRENGMEIAAPIRVVRFPAGTVPPKLDEIKPS